LRSNVKNVLRYYPEEESKKKSFMNEIIKHSKDVPDPRKYSKITIWAPKDGIRNKGIIQSKKITLFSQMSKDSKGTPGPATYKTEKSKDYFHRILGTYKR
jgi:hypothetical protein